MDPEQNKQKQQQKPSQSNQVNHNEQAEKVQEKVEINQQGNNSGNDDSLNQQEIQLINVIENGQNLGEDQWEDDDECDDDQQELQEEQSNSQMIELSEVNPQQVLGCQHYQRNCSVEAPCCKIFYSCKLCHDQKYQGPKSNGCKTERMEFDKVANIKCLKCQKIQTPSQKCINPQCEITFGQYACLKCKLYENKPSKVDDIFHCDDCKMCRRGKRQNYFHCKVCGYCRPMIQENNHRCSEDSGMAQCPICLQVLKFSTKFYIALPCGHLIHNICLQGLRAINCPVCGMAIQKMSQSQNKQIDQMIEKTKDNLPGELKGKKVDILCNECLTKTKDAQFHFYGIKCQNCGTYNTKMI